MEKTQQAVSTFEIVQRQKVGRWQRGSLIPVQTCHYVLANVYYRLLLLIIVYLIVYVTQFEAQQVG